MINSIAIIEKYRVSCDSKELQLPFSGEHLYDNNLLHEMCCEMIEICPHEVALELSAMRSSQWQTIDDVKDWINEFCKGYWTRYSFNYQISLTKLRVKSISLHVIYAFEKELDAFAFKLNW